MAGELSDAELRIVARLVNEASAPLRALEAEVSQFGATSQKSFDAAQKSVAAMDRAVSTTAEHARAATREVERVPAGAGGRGGSGAGGPSPVPDLNAEARARDLAVERIEEYIAALNHERQILRLDGNEREVAIARRRAEIVAIRGGLNDRKGYVDQVERSVRALQAERAELARRPVSGGFTSGVLGLATQGAPVLGLVASQAQQGAQSLREVASAAGLSGTALAAVGATAAGVVALASALGFAARESLQLTSSLRLAVTLSADAAENIDELRIASHEFAVQLATDSADAGAAVSAAYQAGAKSAEDAIELARAAAAAQALGLGTQAQAVEKIDGVLDSYRLKIKDSATLTRELWVAAREGEQPFGQFTDGVASAGIAATQLGFQAREVAALLSVMTRNGLTATQAAAGLNQILIKLGNPKDQTRLRLVSEGLDLSEQALQAGGIIGVFTQLEQIANRNPDLLEEVFGSPRTARAIFAATNDGAREALDTIEKMQSATQDAGAAINRSLNDPSERLQRTWVSIKEGFAGVGGGIASVLADLFGTSAQQVEIESAELQDLRKRLAEALVADDQQAVDAATKGLQKLIDDAWNRVTGVTLRPPVGLHFGPDGGLRGVIDRDAEAQRNLEDIQDRALTAKRAIDIVNETAQALRKPLRELKEDGTIQLVVVPPKDPPRVAPKLDFDKLRDEINRTLAGDPLVVQVRPQADPEAVRQARAVLEFFKDTPQTRISSIDQQSIQSAIAVIKEYDEARRSSLELEGRLQRAGLEGIQREIADRAAARLQVRREIDELQRKGVVVDQLRQAQVEANEADDERAAREREGAALARRAEVLAALSREADLRAKVAAEGTDQAAADRAQSQAITARADAAQAAADAAAAAATNAARGNREQEETTRRLNEQRDLGVKLERQAAEETLRREFVARQRAGATQIAGLEGELGIGLEAELRAIEETFNARRAAARQAEADREIETKDLETILRLLNLIEDQQTELAEFDAGVAVREQIAQLQSSTANTLGDQARAAEELLRIDGERLILTARQNGATADQIRQLEELLKLQGQITDARARGERLFGTGDELQLGTASRIQFDEAALRAEVHDKILPLLDEIRRTLSDNTIPDDVVVERIRRIREEIKLIETDARRSTSEAGRAFVDAIRDRGDELGDTVRNFADLGRSQVDNLQNSIAGFFDRIVISGTNAKQSLKEFFREFLIGMARAVNQAVAAEAASRLIRLLAGAGAVASGGATGVVTNAAGLPVAAMGGVFAHQSQNQVRVPNFSQPIPLRQYRMGGIADEPQMAIYGEGPGAEAYVPLPGPNRGIPVELRGRRGSNVAFHATFNISGTDPRTLRQQMAEIAPDLANMVADVVHRGESRVARQRLGNF